MKAWVALEAPRKRAASPCAGSPCSGSAMPSSVRRLADPSPCAGSAMPSSSLVIPCLRKAATSSSLYALVITQLKHTKRATYKYIPCQIRLHFWICDTGTRRWPITVIVSLVYCCDNVRRCKDFTPNTHPRPYRQDPMARATPPHPRATSGASHQGIEGPVDPRPTNIVSIVSINTHQHHHPSTPGLRPRGKQSGRGPTHVSNPPLPSHLVSIDIVF